MAQPTTPPRLRHISSPKCRSCWFKFSSGRTVRGTGPPCYRDICDSPTLSGYLNSGLMGYHYAIDLDLMGFHGIMILMVRAAVWNTKSLRCFVAMNVHLRDTPRKQMEHVYQKWRLRKPVFELRLTKATFKNTLGHKNQSLTWNQQSYPFLSF